jgi:hypothetical protein
LSRSAESGICVSLRRLPLVRYPTGILYDEDSSDFAGQQEEEIAFNAAIEALAREDCSVAVWCLSKNYEDHLRDALGTRYEQLCAKHVYRKPTRARLIAMEPGLPVPEPLERVLRWLAGVE